MSRKAIFLIVNILSLFSIISSQELKEVMHYVKSINIDTIKSQNIKVVGWDLVWPHELMPSVSKYLFEEIDIVENIAPKGNPNRPGDKHEKKYICVHDTGDATFTAKQWNEAVYNAKLGDKPYEVSYQYVVGNDGYYHNIPDDETAYHAGDGAQSGSYFREYATGVFGDEPKPHVGISSDGYYTINGKKTIVKAPTKNGVILNEKYFNDLGIYTSIKDGEYYIGNTWYSSTYGYISNHGGNTNSIGIESCVNNGTDIYLTWQRLAKLVAKLMNDNNLGIDSVVQHHYFSGKNCPQTMRTAGRWEYFLDLVKVEYNILQYKKLGFKFELISLNEKLVTNTGRVIKKGSNISLRATYKIRITNKKGEFLEETFTSVISPKNPLV